MSSLKFPNDGSGKLFDTIFKLHDLTNDSQLSQLTGIHSTKISKIRNGSERLTDGCRIAILRNTKVNTLEQIDKLTKAR